MKKVKVMVYVTFFICGICSSLYATGTRDMGLGLFEYPWLIDGLQTYIYNNPAYTGKFGDRIYAERIGIIDGYSKGGVIYSVKGKLFLGVDLGAPVDTNIWNTNVVDSLFHLDVYSAKCDSKYNHSSSSQALNAYQVELLDQSILDLKDPFDASEVVGTSTVSPMLREKLTQKNFSALMSYEFNKFALGVYGGYATSWKHYRDSASATNAHEEYNLINAEYSAKVGIGYIFNNKLNVDLASSFIMYFLDNNYMSRKPGIDYDMSYKSNNAFDVSAQLRINYMMTNDQKVHFYTSYAMLNRSTKGQMIINDSNNNLNNCNATDTFDRKGYSLDIGASDEIRVNQNMVVYVGLMTTLKVFKNSYYGDDKIAPANNVDKYTLEYKRIEVPVVLGLEANLTENWKGRLGVVQKIYKPLSYEGENIINQGANKVPTTINEISSSSSILYTGVSYKLNNFSFDWLMNVDLFTVGPYIISGKAWTSGNENPLAFAFAVTYNFASTLTQ